jgi:hypothetical protein
VSGSSIVVKMGRRVRPPASLRAALALAVVLLLASAGPVLADPPDEGTATEVAPPVPVWTVNIYDQGLVRNQNPDPLACTAAATESMLNLIARASLDDLPPPRGGTLPTTSFVWQVDTSFAQVENILAYERQNMTMWRSSPGTDPHGWRNALNYFGWGSMRAGVYVDSAYSSFADAARQTVHSLATTGKPVGILGWFGGHAQYVTGYTVQGEDPRVSDDYTILGVYLTDPLQADGILNVYVTYSTWQSGPLYMRFTPYWHDDSPFADPIDGQVGNWEWRGKWVIIDAIR